jgi:hypothetical protein
VSVYCGSTDGIFLVTPFRGWVRSTPAGEAKTDGHNSDRDRGKREHYPCNREYTQKPRKIVGSRIILELSALGARGGGRGFHGPERMQNHLFDVLTLFHELWLVRADPSLPRLSTPGCLQSLPAVGLPAGASSIYFLPSFAEPKELVNTKQNPTRNGRGAPESVKAQRRSSTLLHTEQLPQA